MARRVQPVFLEMKEAPTDHKEMSHVAMAALAVAVVVIAALGLIYVSRHYHEHPGAVLGVLVGAPVVILLAIVIARSRRRAHV